MKFSDIFSDIAKEVTSEPDELERLLLNGNHSVVIFGAGSVGEAVAKCLSDKGIKITAFCDNNKSGIFERFNAPIVNIKTLISDYKDAILIICVSPLHNDNMKKQVIDAGFPKNTIFQRYNAWHYYSIDEFKQNYYDGYEWAYNFFTDDWSRDIIIHRIRGYLFHCELPYIAYEKQYFEEGFIKLSPDEVFYDIGGFDGDTSEAFIKHTDRKYKQIFFFEPDEINLSKATGKLKNFTRIHYINKACWSKEDTLNFSSESGSSRLISDGNISVSTISVDSFLNTTSDALPPTFIKMDIEGAEKEALIGAAKTIKSVKPKLAISAYHKPQDVYELPKLIMKYGNYMMRLSHYTPGMNETVLYAMPT